MFLKWFHCVYFIFRQSVLVKWIQTCHLVLVWLRKRYISQNSKYHYVHLWAVLVKINSVNCLAHLISFGRSLKFSIEMTFPKFPIEMTVQIPWHSNMLGMESQLSSTILPRQTISYGLFCITWSRWTLIQSRKMWSETHPFAHNSEVQSTGSTTMWPITEPWGYFLCWFISCLLVYLSWER
jgi:hypothetical protein